MPHEPRRNLFAAVRFSVYGVLLGVIGGVPLGVALSSGGWLLPNAGLDVGGFDRTSASMAPGGDPVDPLDPFNLDGLVEPREHIIHGGPPKDGIPALVDPTSVPVSRAVAISPDDRVIGVAMNGEARAYPIRLLNYHEIVNDVLGGVPIAVVYCPLCDSVSVVDRRVGGDTVTFGVSGLLLHSNVLMYDRSHDALWTQLGGRAISGPFAGRALSHFNSWEIARFDAWSHRFPTGRVISLDTGHERNYERSPYAEYFENDDLYFPVPRDDRLPRRKVPVVGVQVGDRTCAVPVEAVHRAPGGRLEVPLGQQRVILEADASGAQEIAIIDAPEGARAVHTFWFAWAAFHPNTAVYGVRPTTQPQSAP